MNNQEAIKHLKDIRDGAQVVLDGGFGNKTAEHDLVYRNRVA